MSTGERKPDQVELVPITEQIEARVNESVRDVEPREPPTPPPQEPPPVELSEIEPPPGELWAPPPVPFDGRRAMKWIGVILVLALASAGFLVFTDAGRDLLPSSMKPQAKKVAGDIEQKVKRVGQDEFYTFSDDDGVVHIVDDLEKVPPEYRSRAKKKL
jgi:hypothetical protein